MKEPLLRFENIYKSFKEKTVIKNLNLTINEGEILALIGRSGCGKSTLMKILIGFHKEDSGKIYYKGKNVSEDINILRKAVGYTTQDNSFYGKLTVYENMQYYSELYGIKHAKIHEILESVELHTNKNTLAESMSGGMQRRLDFAISLIHDPDILILDEPTTGLDPMLVEQFWEIVKKVRDLGKTIIVSSHIFSELQENCTSAAVMDKGSIVKIISVKKDKDLYKEFIRSLK